MSCSFQLISQWLQTIYEVAISRRPGMRLIALSATANTVIRQSLGILAPNASSNLGAV